MMRLPSPDYKKTPHGEGIRVGGTNGKCLVYEAI